MKWWVAGATEQSSWLKRERTSLFNRSRRRNIGALDHIKEVLHIREVAPIGGPNLTTGKCNFRDPLLA